MCDDTPDTETATQVDADLRCCQCGYNLRSLQIDAHCPECGKPVQHSIGTYRVERWPYTAIEPSRLLAFGLITMLAVGLGLIPWAIGLGMLIWRLPASLHWRIVKHATWLSFLAVVACIVWALFAQPKSTVAIDIGNDTVIAIFTASLLVHYLCIFLIAIGITSSAKMYLAMGLAAFCLMATGATVLVALVTDRSLAAAAITLVLSGAFWMLLGTFYWAYVANTLDEQKQALLRVSLDLPREPAPTQTL